MRVPFVLCAVAVVLAACDGPTDPATSPTLASEASLRAHIDLRLRLIEDLLRALNLRSGNL